MDPERLPPVPARCHFHRVTLQSRPAFVKHRGKENKSVLSESFADRVCSVVTSALQEREVVTVLWIFCCLTQLNFWSDCSKKKKKRKKNLCSLLKVIPVKSFCWRHTWLFPLRGFYILEIDCQFSSLRNQIWLASCYTKPLTLLTLVTITLPLLCKEVLNHRCPCLGVIVQLNRALSHSLSATTSPRDSVGQRFMLWAVLMETLKRATGVIFTVLYRQYGGDTRERRGQRAASGTTGAQLVGASASV